MNEVPAESTVEIEPAVTSAANSAAVATITACFIALIFVGDVWLVSFTVPMAVLLLPVLFLYRWRQIGIAPGAYLLAAIIGLVAIQTAVGRSIAPRSDLAVWAPMLFAAAAIVCVAGVPLKSGQLLRAFGVGGLSSAAVMVCMMLWSPGQFFLVPGQNHVLIGIEYKEKVVADRKIASQKLGNLPAADRPMNYQRRASDPLPELQVVDRPLTADTLAFYLLKNKAKNFLGRSNYIAAFFVFLFSVFLFGGRRWLATAMAACVCLTMARLGIAFVGVVLGLYFFRKSGYRALPLGIVFVCMATAALVAAFIWRDQLAAQPWTTSLAVRLDLIESGFGPIAARPVLGALRSVILEENNLNIIWNPHNSIVWVWANFGIIGLLLYATYVTTALRTIAKAAAQSQLWSGIVVGMTVLLVWSLTEIILPTPAFDLLLASLYALAYTEIKGGPPPLLKQGQWILSGLVTRRARDSTAAVYGLQPTATSTSQ